MPGINMMPSGSTLQIPLDACTGFSAKAGKAQVTLTWTDPKDKYATPEGETAQDPDQLVSVWEYTQIIRKTGSQPTGPHDGELVVSSSVRDQYATTGYVDTGLTNDTLYYYAAFAYNTDGVASEGAFTSATPMAGTPLSELAEGTIIKINENGAPVEFYVAEHDYQSPLNGIGRTLILRKNLYNYIAWRSSGKNAYAGSTLDNWLNNNYPSLLSSAVNTMIQETLFPYTVGNYNWAVETLSRRFFVLSMTELGKSSSDFNVEGTPLEIASSILATQAPDFPPPSDWSANASYWSRSPCISNSSMAYGIINGSGTNKTTISLNYWSSRPCFMLPSTALVDQDLNLIES